MRLSPQLLLCFLLLVAVMTLACGSSPHLLQSVTVSPATADAQNYPGGLVQFTATGIFNTKPTPVTPIKATWGACVKTAGSQQPTNVVTISNSGLAQCVSGAATGTFTVWAASSDTKGPECLAETACSGACGTITGYAQITCP